MLWAVCLDLILYMLVVYCNFVFLNKHIFPAIPQKSTRKIQDLKVSQLSHVYPKSSRNSCNKSDLTAEQAKNFANLGKFRAILHPLT